MILFVAGRKLASVTQVVVALELASGGTGNADTVVLCLINHPISGDYGSALFVNRRLQAVDDPVDAVDRITMLCFKNSDTIFRVGEISFELFPLRRQRTNHRF